MKKMKCNLCKDEFHGYGNNPAPLITKSTDRCCDYCNSKFVVPIRIGLSVDCKTQDEYDAKMVQFQRTFRLDMLDIK